MTRSLRGLKTASALRSEAAETANKMPMSVRRSGPRILSSLRLAIIAVLACVAVRAWAEPSTLATVNDIARTLSESEFQSPQHHVDAAGISYIDYLGIRVRPGREVWAKNRLGFEVHPMPLGSLAQSPIEITLVDGTRSQPFVSDPDLYEHSLDRTRLPAHGNLGVSGFRITAPLNHPAVMDELIVFQGASYFRVLSKGQVYGLSARGLSIRAGKDQPEEFPTFRHFWIERPSSPTTLVVYALLDSASVTGAYRFTIRPGEVTTVEVDATLYPRRDVSDVGFAPLSSMFFYGIGDGAKRGDYRPEVHDSEGLLIHNGNREMLWRPLRNPQTRQISGFDDLDLKGFGLIQRQRAFNLYDDLEAQYHKRPSAWIEPIGSWGPGWVELVEIPTDSEVHDNIVAQWRPVGGLTAGKPHHLSYRISWPNTPASSGAFQVHWTRIEPVPQDNGPGATRFSIDFIRAPGGKAAVLPTAQLSATAGTVRSQTVQTNLETGGVRVTFIFDPENVDVSELRLSLSGDVQSEVWLYRWTREDR